MMATDSAPGPGGEPRSGQQSRQRRQSAWPRRAWQRRRAVIVPGVIALAIAAGVLIGSGCSGGHAAGHARARTAAAPLPRRRPSQRQSHSVELLVEASGDLLIHSPIFDRALVLG